MADKISFNTQISGRVRLATESDVPHLHKLMYQMAKYHNYTKVFNATEASISTNLFKSNNPCPPFYSVTTFILEVSPNSFPQKNTKHPIFDPILKTINLDSPILDLELELFRTNNNISSIISQVDSGKDGVHANLSLSCEGRETVSDRSSAQEMFRTNNNISSIISEVGLGKDGVCADLSLSCKGRETVSDRSSAQELLRTNNNISSIISQVGSRKDDVCADLSLSCEDRETISDRPSAQEVFVANEDSNVFIAGYVLFFPSYSGYFEKPGFFIENMYVRECYRKCGFGKMLFSTVASQAVKMGFTKVDWLTVGWNENAIDFYLGMGAYIMQDVKRFRLSGEGLDAFATNDQDVDKS